MSSNTHDEWLSDENKFYYIIVLAFFAIVVAAIIYGTLSETSHSKSKAESESELELETKLHPETELYLVPNVETKSESETMMSSYEKFSIKENPGSGTINGIAEFYAERIANDAFKNVVEPCSRVAKQQDVEVCLINYNGYYNSVLKENLIDMFTKLKELNGSYVDYITDFKTKEELYFAQKMTDAFSSALTDTLKYLSQDYSSDDKFDKDTFTPILIHYLESTLISALNAVFGVAPARADPKKLPFINPNAMSTGKGSTHPTNRTLYLTCHDLSSGKINVFVDGVRVMCQK